MKRIAGTLKLELAQYREVEAFTQFGSDLDPTTLRSLNRGLRLIELLKQAQYEPQDIRLQIVIISAGMLGFLDTLQVSAVRVLENIIKNSLFFSPWLYCHLPEMKLASTTSDAQLLLKIRLFLGYVQTLTQIVRNVSAIAHEQLLTVLIRKPQWFFSDTSMFRSELA